MSRSDILELAFRGGAAPLGRALVRTAERVGWEAVLIWACGFAAMTAGIYFLFWVWRRNRRTGAGAA
jgi:hypothetical protein